MSDMNPIDHLFKRLEKAGIPRPDKVVADAIRNTYETMFNDPKHLEDAVSKCKEFVETFFEARRACAAAGGDPCKEFGGLSPTIIMATSANADKSYEFEVMALDEIIFKASAASEGSKPAEEYHGPLEEKFGSGVSGPTDIETYVNVGRILVEDLGKVPFVVGVVAVVVPLSGFGSMRVSMPDGSVGKIPDSSVGHIMIGVSRPNVSLSGSNFDFITVVGVMNDDDTVTWYDSYPRSFALPTVSGIMDGIAHATADEVKKKISDVMKSMGHSDEEDDEGEDEKKTPVRIAVDSVDSDMSTYHTMLKKLQSDDPPDEDAPGESDSPKPNPHRRF